MEKWRKRDERMNGTDVVWMEEGGVKEWMMVVNGVRLSLVFFN